MSGNMANMDTEALMKRVKGMEAAIEKLMGKYSHIIKRPL